MSGQIGKDRYQKRLRIGVRFDGEHFVLLDGQPLPELNKGSTAELVVAPETIKDEIVRQRLSEQRSIPFLSKDSLILLGVSRTMIGNSPPEGLTLPERYPIRSGELFVEVQLNEDLHLQLRGDQEARLSSCRCTIVAVEKEAQSLNHAFTLISELYETKRRSHSGNVFDRGYLILTSGEWTSLNQLRAEVIAKALSSSDVDAQLSS